MKFEYNDKKINDFNYTLFTEDFNTSTNLIHRFRKATSEYSSMETGTIFS